MKILEKYPYRVLHPKLVSIVTTVDENGVPNACTIAWSMPVSVKPPLLAIALNKKNKTTKNIKITKEFVINIPDRSKLTLVESCGEISGWEVNKFEKFQIPKAPSSKVKAPRIANCLGYVECKLYAQYDGGDHYIFVGEILHAEADERFFDQMWHDAELVLHFGGDTYGKPVKF